MVVSWNNFDKDTYGKQLVRAADSIGANIAEGSGRGTPKDNKRFIRIEEVLLMKQNFDCAGLLFEV